jgi:hypothetical protein
MLPTGSYPIGKLLPHLELFAHGHFFLNSTLGLERAFELGIPHRVLSPISTNPVGRVWTSPASCAGTSCNLMAMDH